MSPCFYIPKIFQAFPFTDISYICSSVSPSGSFIYSSNSFFNSYGASSVRCQLSTSATKYGLFQNEGILFIYFTPSYTVCSVFLNHTFCNQFLLVFFFEIWYKLSKERIVLEPRVPFPEWLTGSMNGSFYFLPYTFKTSKFFNKTIF